MGVWELKEMVKARGKKEMVKGRDLEDAQDVEYMGEKEKRYGVCSVHEQKCVRGSACRRGMQESVE